MPEEPTSDESVRTVYIADEDESVQRGDALVAAFNAVADTYLGTRQDAIEATFRWLADQIVPPNPD
jgi:hypothetical protein